MRSWWVVVIVIAGCRTQPLGFNCSSDSQCGSGGTCIGGACAFVDATCPSGYRLDQSAGGAAGQCVPVDDMAAAVVVEPPDLAETIVIDMAAPLPPDLAQPLDMSITCAQVGHDCTVGTGACAQLGHVVCTAQGVGACDATPGSPDNSGTWHLAAAANGSWDWDCDGAVQYQYPDGTNNPPPPMEVDCQSLIGIAQCYADHWFYSGARQPSCGYHVDSPVCNFSNGGCTGPVAYYDKQQGCH